MSRELGQQVQAAQDSAQAMADIAHVHRWFAEQFIQRLERITVAIEKMKCPPPA